MAGDRVLRDRIELALAPLSPLPIVATVHGGTVYLEGTVVTEQQRRHAEAMMRSLPEVQAVVNRLHVDPAGLSAAPPPLRAAGAFDEEPADSPAGSNDARSAIESSVEELVEHLPEPDVYFPPTDPVVEPSGPEHFEEIEVVGGFASTSMQPPFEDQNHSAHFLDDDAIGEDVRTALRRDASTTDLPVYVAVRDGVVHLRGMVRSIEDVELIEEVVSRIPGVLGVEDHLDVEGM